MSHEALYNYGNGHELNNRINEEEKPRKVINMRVFVRNIMQVF